MGHSLVMIFDAMGRFLHQSMDPAPERMFHLMSGLALAAVGLRLRRSLE